MNGNEKTDTAKAITAWTRRGAVSVALVAQLLVAGATATWGVHRYQVIQAEKTPPQPVLEPKRYESRYDRAEVVSDEQLQRTLLKHCLHLQHFLIKFELLSQSLSLPL